MSAVRIYAESPDTSVWNEFHFIVLHRSLLRYRSFDGSHSEGGIA